MKTAILSIGFIFACGTPSPAKYLLKTGYYKTVNLDPSSLKLLLADREATLTEPSSRHFFRFTDARGRHEISDCEGRKKDAPHVCYNIFHVTADDDLAYRTRFLRILNGPFGVVLNLLV